MAEVADNWRNEIVKPPKDTRVQTEVSIYKTSDKSISLNFFYI